MRKLLVVVIGLLLSGCKSGTGPGRVENAGSPRIYSLSDIDQEMKEAKLELGATREDVRAFFKTHSNYHVCRDHEVFLVAVVRNATVDVKADDIYVVINFPNGKVTEMQVGPPQFDVNNLPSYCR